MKKKIMSWVCISIIATLIYSISTQGFAENNIMFNLGKLVVPFIFSFVFPLFMGLIVTAFSYFFTKKMELVFSRTMWISQILFIIFLFISMKGQSEAKNSIPLFYDLQKTKQVSNEYISFRIPQHWNYQDMPLMSGQLYNILCYSQMENMRISSAPNTNNISAKSYYESYKKLLFNDLNNRSQRLKILNEKSIIFHNEQAIKVTYETTYKDHKFHCETICFSKKNIMIIISTSISDYNQNQLINDILNSLTFN